MQTLVFIKTSHIAETPCALSPSQHINRFLGSDLSHTLDKYFLLYGTCGTQNITTKLHRTLIVPVVLNGCETWSLTSRGNLG